MFSRRAAAAVLPSSATARMNLIWLSVMGIVSIYLVYINTVFLYISHNVVTYLKQRWER